MSPLNILHVEDSADDAALISQALARHGIEARIQLVSTKQDYLQALEKGRVDLIMADRGVPGLSGTSALELARRSLPNIPFISVSGHLDPQDALDSLKAGVTACVLKDHWWQLIAAVRQALALARQENEIRRLTRWNAGKDRLVQAVQDLSLARSLNEITLIVRRAARELTGADGATFVLRENDLCHYADEDAIAPLWKGKRFPMSACISGWVMLNAQSAVIEDIYSDPRIPADAYRPTFVKSLAMVPIRTEQPIGAIGNYWAERRLPKPDEVKLLQALANTTAVAMENVQVYAELEKRVRDRTLQLEAANQELESFSYSVSHDLQAPLRRMATLADWLWEDNGSTLDPKAAGFLTSIRNDVQRMTALIRDLLRLAHWGRVELHCVPLDLTQLALEISSKLQKSANDRPVDWIIQENLRSAADEGLMRVVLDNLLSNAWKYTGKVDRARIEFGAMDQADGRVYFVRDNGAGFDMQYASKLFAPFQRLHSDKEFAGTGVGLATVQRVIHRHGGRVWAESETGKGATFFFTLAPESAG